MKFTELLRRLFITKKCVICKEPISYDAYEPFCSECMEHWKAFLEIKCHKCGYKHKECTCLPSQVRQIGKNGAVWCFFYDSKANLKANNLVFTLKREYNKDMIDFCTSEMARNIVLHSSRHGINYKDYCITYTPRRKSGKNKYGFDHSKKLAKSLASKLGIRVEKCLKNIGKKEQKALTKEGRKENAKSSYIVRRKAKIENQKYFLVDDIITSGSTMKACADILLSQGAKDIIPVSYAKDNR